MKLIIVESPTKSKTLSRFLGKGYEACATKGHIRDLPRKAFGIDIENNFEPKYLIMSSKKPVLKELKEMEKKAEDMFLAMDPDREGEAIAWHLTEALKLKKPKRIVFHEITKSAIERALENPGSINMKLVDAQQARRILDRIVGYKLSPFLWKKLVRGLSAGRVQSVAVRLVVEREREIEAFVPQEYWSIEALLSPEAPALSNAEVPSEEKEFTSLLIGRDGKKIPKMGIKNKKEADGLVKDLEGAEYQIAGLEKGERRRRPYPPFTTSSLQQEAWKRLHFSAKFTMRAAQKLYEKGFITYHRSDSLNIAETALRSAEKFITGKLGKEYWPGFARRYKTKSKTAQEAHEAVRPTYPEKTPESLASGKGKLTGADFKLYELIWKRFIASQMSEAVFDTVTADIAALPKGEGFPSGEKRYLFRSTGQTLRFDGFLKVYPMNFAESDLPPLQEGEALRLLKIVPSQHFTQPPARYTEASLIKTLEENGIGRPSTYAPIISTIQERNYVEKDEKRRFKPTEIGGAVNDILVNHFPEIVDVGFTAKMEEELDEVSRGEKEWKEVIREFYEPFEKNLKKKEKEVPDKRKTYETTDKKCPECGSPLVIKLGRYGKFYACSDFPKCKYTAPLEENRLGMKCPKCKKGKIVEKRTKKGKIFYGCSEWPDCDFATWYKPTGELCPKCSAPLIITRRGQVKCSNKECDFKKEKKSD